MSEVRSHRVDDAADLLAVVTAARQRIQRADSRSGSRAQLLRDLDEWSNCELGRWMLLHGGWDAHWARYCVDYPLTHAHDAHPPDTLEHFYLTSAPGIVATQQRAAIFADVLAELVIDGTTAMAIPCGYMDELLRLPNVSAAHSLIGMDAERPALAGAADSAREQGLSAQTVLALGDAWNLAGAEVVSGDADAYAQAVAGGTDVMVSNGLNMYVPDDAEVIALYRCLRAPLRRFGTLVVSALTPPDTWDLADVAPEVITRVRGLMLINPMMWGNYRSVDTTTAQLADAGFEVREVRWDQRRIFPTYVATAV